MGFRIQQNCPQCGAPLELEETDRLISCPYCGIGSIIVPSDYLRYVMHHNAPGKQIIYAPYLRFIGAAYYCQGDKIDYRTVDISSPATSFKPLSKSLGVRSQTVKASFVNPEMEGLFLPITEDPDDIVASAAMLTRITNNNIIPKPRRRLIEKPLRDDLAFQIGSTIVGMFADSPLEFGSLSYRSNPSYSAPEPEEEILFHEIIGETLSIIYLPLYLENDMLYDAIINEPLGKIDEESTTAMQAAGNSRWKVDFLPLLCPHCGWELQGSRNSIAFTCSNCCTAWEIGGGKLSKTPLLSIPAENGACGHLPFWKITATCPGLGIRTYADLVHLEKPIAPADQYADRNATFLVPAFKIAPKVFLATAQRITFTQHKFPPEEEQAEINSLCAITMPREEAIQSLKLVLASGAHETRQVSRQLPEVEIEVTDSALIYLPFNDSGYELSSCYGGPATIIKQALEMASAGPQFEKEKEPEVISVTCPLCGKEVPGGLRNCPYCGIGL